jgi:hypothetical protein
MTCPYLLTERMKFARRVQIFSAKQQTTVVAAQTSRAGVMAFSLIIGKAFPVRRAYGRRTRFGSVSRHNAA